MSLFDIDDLQYIGENLRSDLAALKGASILLTGSTGFIGKGLLETFFWLNEVHSLGLKVISISRNPEKFFFSHPHFKKNKEFILLNGDIRKDIFCLDCSQVDFVIHAATDVVGRSAPLDIFNTCVNGTNNIIKIAKKRNCKSFLLMSSGAVYGPQPDYISSLSETFFGGTDLSSPKSAYALGKQVAEWLVHQSASEIMEVKIARGFAFTGPYLPLDQHFAIGNFIGAALQNRPIDILGDGTTLRTYLHSRDLCLWLIKVLLRGKSQEIWNIGGAEVISISELAFLIRDVLNSTSKISIQGKTTGKIDRYIPCIDKIAKDLGLAPSVDLKNAITKTADWNLRYGNI
jgi:dTDP-glucose 4,6-dehydratase